MNTRLTFLFICLMKTGFCLAQSIASKTYAWNDSPLAKKATSEQRAILEGSTTDFSHLKIHATTLPAHRKPHPVHKHDDEELIIIREGQLTITIEGKTRTLGPGSVALIIPGDKHGFANNSDASATYYVMRYTSKEPLDLERGRKAGGSFWIDWNDVAFQPHDKGGIRRMFDRATGMTKRFEMHVTTLDQGLWSHPAHTHRAAEILLMKEDSSQESIDGKLVAATTGDLIFLESNVPHALHNTSKGSCTYFAFQFE